MLGLRDLRAGSPSEGAADVLVLTADQPAAVEIPPGVAHGFWFPEASIHVYAVSHYWDPGRRARRALGRPRMASRGPPS